MSTKTQDPVIGDGSLHVGDRVVYPNQGICRITGVEIKQIAGQSWEVVTLSREEDGATVMVPKAKVMGIGLRKVADVAAIDRVFDELATPNTDPQLDWKVRHRENADRMTGGGLFGTVEVLKGLHALSRVRPLPPKERELLRFVTCEPEPSPAVLLRSAPSPIIRPARATPKPVFRWAATPSCARREAMNVPISP